MLRSGTTEREVRLQLTCLVVSVGLHAVLTAMVWQGAGLLPTGEEPIIVSLVDRPASSPAGFPSLPVDVPAPKVKSPAPARRARPVLPPAAPKPKAVEAPPVEPRQVVSEKTDDVMVEIVQPQPLDVASLPGGAGVGGAIAAGTDRGDGTVSGSGGQGRARGREGGGEDSVAGLIKATPRYESNPLPPYPRLARQNHWEGTVRLRARVTAGGDIEKVSLERGSGHEVLDRAALEGVKRWRFIPATRNGMPVACEVSIPVAFRLTE